MRRSVMMVLAIMLMIGCAATLLYMNRALALEPPQAFADREPLAVDLPRIPVGGNVLVQAPVQTTQPRNYPLVGEATFDPMSRRITVVEAQPDDESTNLARQIRELGSSDPAKTDELKARLRGILEKTFGERQSQQRQELARLQDRLKSLELTLTRRDALKDQIVGRRLDALIDADGDLWDSSRDQGILRVVPNPNGLVPANSSPRSTGMSMPRPTPGTMPMTAPPTGTTVLVPGTGPARSTYGATLEAPPGFTTPRSPSPSRTADETTSNPAPAQGLSRSSVVTLLRSLAKADSDANRAETLQKKGYMTKAEFDRLHADLRYQRDLLDSYRDEATARGKILELALRKAKLKADAAVAEQTRMEELFKHKAVSTTELKKTELEAQSALIDLEQAQLEVDEHKKLLDVFPKPEGDPNVPTGTTPPMGAAPSADLLPLPVDPTVPASADAATGAFRAIEPAALPPSADPPPAGSNDQLTPAVGAPPDPIVPVEPAPVGGAAPEPVSTEPAPPATTP